MTLNDIAKDIPSWVPWGIAGLAFTGMIAHATARIYNSTKAANVSFRELQATYKNDFSKDELIAFYEDLLKIKPGLWGKNEKIATQLTENLEKQIMVYATEEVQDAISKGAVIDFSSSILPHSPTYKRAIELFRSQNI